MKGMILAAGLGTRLRPLTLERAKPAIPLLGEPLIHRLVRRLMGCGVSQFRVNLHHLPDTIEKVFDSNDQRLPVSFSYEPEILGTAGGLKANESFFDEGTFLMANGDIVMEFPLEEALAFHKSREALATLILFRQEEPCRYFPVRIDGEGRLHNFKGVESPAGKALSTSYVFTGIHILEPRLFDYIPIGCFYEITDQVYPAALANGERILGFPVDGYWNDVGAPCRYLEAQRYLFERSAIGLPVHVAADALVEKGAMLGAYVSACAGAVVEAGAFVEDSVLWEGARVEKGARVSGCILGSGVSVRSRCINRIVTRNGEAPVVCA